MGHFEMFTTLVVFYCEHSKLNAKVLLSRIDINANTYVLNYLMFFYILFKLVLGCKVFILFKTPSNMYTPSDINFSDQMLCMSQSNCHNIRTVCIFLKTAYLYVTKGNFCIVICH